MTNLVYYTVGFDNKYIDLIQFSLMTLRRKNSIDVMVICDKLLVDECSKKLSMFKNVQIVECENSTDAMDSSIKKVKFFDYNTSIYDKVLFVDSDIIVDIDLNLIFDKIVDEYKLYAFAEHKDLGHHAGKYHSLMNYTFEDYLFFEKNNIYPFNCGLFGFINTSDMKTHFLNILNMINKYEGEYWYEQSFMNVYFNKLNLVDTKVINSSNCVMNIDISKIIAKPNLSWLHINNRNKLFHFCYDRGADKKLTHMKYWFNNYIR